MKIRLVKAVGVRVQDGRLLAEGLLKYKQGKNELVVEGLSGSGIAIHNVFGNGISMMSVVSGNSIYVNGVRVDGHSNKNDKDYVKMDIPLNGSKIKVIECSGSSTLKIKDKNVLDSRCTISLSGSSDVRVTMESISELNMNLSGSSDMKGHVTTERLDAHLSGCSDTSGIFVSGSGSVHASGCSSAYIYATNKKKISKSSSGMSKIKVTTRQKAESSDSSDSSSSDNSDNNNIPLIKKRKVSNDRLSIEKETIIPDDKKKEMKKDAVLYESD